MQVLQALLQKQAVAAVQRFHAGLQRLLQRQAQRVRAGRLLRGGVRQRLRRHVKGGTQACHVHGGAVFGLLARHLRLHGSPKALLRLGAVGGAADPGQ